MIVEVNAETLKCAAEIHSASWQSSHRAFCSKEFVEKHNAEHQKEYLQNEINAGKIIYMLLDKSPVGIVSVNNNIIENLYVLPFEQHKGYGTQLLRFALGKCKNKAYLYVLSNNLNAIKLYQKQGFKLTGRKKQLSDEISELEMIYKAWPEKS